MDNRKLLFQLLRKQTLNETAGKGTKENEKKICRIITTAIIAEQMVNAKRAFDRTRRRREKKKKKKLKNEK